MNDHNDIMLIQKRLENAVREIRNMTMSVGQAKQVKDYDSDRRKNLLAAACVPFLKAGHSAASAEMEARAFIAASGGLDELARQREDAEKTIAKWDAAFCTYEAARSLLSMAKETIHTIQ
jgi:hypothetical protein